jgi:streptogramin lyase
MEMVSCGMRFGCAVLWILGVTCRSSDPAPPAPQLFAPALAVFHEVAGEDPGVFLSLQGTALGEPLGGTFEPADCGSRAGGRFVVLRDDGGAIVFRARSTDAAETNSWTNARILVRSPSSAAAAATAQVCAPELSSEPVPVLRYAYDHFDLPPSPGTNAVPLAVAADAAGRVFVNEEFHTQLKWLGPAGSWAQLDLPQAPGPGIFAQTVFGDTRSRIATFGEAILVDPAGRVWLTESGPGPYDGPNPNHSRIVMLDPGTSSVTAFNVPGDDNGALGLAWDEARHRIWFTQGRRASPDVPAAIVHEARLSSFDPDRIVPDNVFDFAPGETCLKDAGAPVGTCSGTTHRRCATDHDCVLADRVCPPGGADDGPCFREYELPADAGVVLPSHLLVHSDGSIWYSAYWGGNHIGRLDPSTGSIQRFPLPDPEGKRACDYGSCSCFSGDASLRCPQNCCLYLLLGWGPWSLVEDRAGAVLFCGQTGLEVAAFDVGRLANAECRSLDRSGRNPCIRQWPVPGAAPATDLVHSIALDADGRVWVTSSPDLGHESDPLHPASVGFLDPPSGRIHMLPPLSLFPYTDGTGRFVSFGGAGIAVDGGGAIWFADFYRHRLGRLRRR